MCALQKPLSWFIFLFQETELRNTKQTRNKYRHRTEFLCGMAFLLIYSVPLYANIFLFQWAGFVQTRPLKRLKLPRRTVILLFYGLLAISDSEAKQKVHKECNSSRSVRALVCRGMAKNTNIWEWKEIGRKQQLLHALIFVWSCIKGQHFLHENAGILQGSVPNNPDAAARRCKTACVPMGITAQRPALHTASSCSATERRDSVRISPKRTVITQVTFVKLHSKHTNKLFYKPDTSLQELELKMSNCT